MSNHWANRPYDWDDREWSGAAWSDTVALHDKRERDAEREYDLLIADLFSDVLTKLEYVLWTEAEMDKYEEAA